MQSTPKSLAFVGGTLVVIVLAFVSGYLLIPKHSSDAPLPSVPPPQIAGELTGAPPSPEVPASKPGIVYENNFTAEPGAEWSTGSLKATLAGGRPYLGDFFPSSKPTLSLKLPPHKLVKLTFDLFLMKSWDGSSPMWGPGLMDIRLGGDDGRSLLHATFCNCGFFSDNNEQSFPDNYPSRPYPAWALAVENQSLGNMVDWGGPQRTFDSSAVYHMVYTFPHADERIDIQWSSMLPDNPNKPFGLTNVKVEALPELAAFTNAEMDELWNDLGDISGGGVKKFYEARWKLVSAGDSATIYIASHYTQLKIPDNITIVDPKGTVKPYPTQATVIHRERARWVLEAIHTPAALELKKAIPTVVPEGGL